MQRRKFRSFGSSAVEEREGCEAGVFEESFPERTSERVKFSEDLRASNTNVTMFLVPPDIIQQYRLPLWIKGCNEVGNRTTKQ